MARKLILKTPLPPGDICTLTAAIESLHRTYPGEYVTDVRTQWRDLFKGNPHITSLADGEGETFDMHYTEFIAKANEVSNPFLRGYCYDLGVHIGRPLELTTNRPHLYLTPEDQVDHPLQPYGNDAVKRYWLITSGVKRDFTAKQWPIEYYQAVVNHLRGKVQFVQVGDAAHDHPPLDGVIDLVGKTTIRQLMQLVYHASGGIGPITLLQHLCAGFEKPYVALLGGREPVTWTQYPLQTTLHTIGGLPCCERKACWRARIVPLGDGSASDMSLCALPVLKMKRPVGKCMAMILPAQVISAVESLTVGVADTTTLTTPRTDVSIGPLASVADVDNHLEKRLELIGYSAWGFDTKIVPAWTPRDWMDATGEKFAYHCLPMVLANQSGWFILAPHDAVAEWNGGLAPTDLKVEPNGKGAGMVAMSQVGSGILTWTIPYVFRTPPGWNLLCRGPANFVKDGLSPLEGLVETDWSVASFSMNWKVTRPGRVEFKAGEPIAMLVPHRRGDLEQFDARVAKMGDNPALCEGYDLWIRSRHEFWEKQKRGDPQVLKEKFQKHYFRGLTNQGLFFPEHQRARKLGVVQFPAGETGSPPPSNLNEPGVV